MTTKNPGVKNLVFSAINFTNEVDEKGGKVQRKTFPKNHYLAIVSISKKLNEDQEVLIGTPEMKEKIIAEQRETLTAEEVEATGGWKPVSDLTDENRGNVVALRYTENELDFTDKERDAIKFFWKETDEVSNAGPEAFEELETLLA